MFLAVEDIISFLNTFYTRQQWMQLIFPRLTFSRTTQQKIIIGTNISLALPPHINLIHFNIVHELQTKYKQTRSLPAYVR